MLILTTLMSRWSYGSNRIQVAAEIKLLQDFMSAVQEDQVRGDYQTSSMTDRSPALLIRGTLARLL